MKTGTKRSVEEHDDKEVTRVRARSGAVRANILVTGTPGTGKSALASVLASELDLEYISVSELAKNIDAFDGWDPMRECHIIDEDKLIDAMEPKLAVGGCIVEYHACDFFPERWFNLVLVLRANTSVLYDRLAARDYSDDKIRENIQCEIMDVLYQEAYESYAEHIVVQLHSNSDTDLVANKNVVIAWYNQWLQEQESSLLLLTGGGEADRAEEGSPEGEQPPLVSSSSLSSVF
mmetsp:Transcript_13242/g.17668  ORF Transcript_13242/g.17668 Transcript_13242/m.17668 type:complete len:234 (-) Transcript_13242:134-835(-)